MTGRILVLKKCPTKNEGQAMSEFYAGVERHTSLRRGQFDVVHLIDREMKQGKLKGADWAEAYERLFVALEGHDGLVIAAGSLPSQVTTGIEIADTHGIPHAVTIAGRALTVFPMYDPGAGMGNKGFLAALAYDLRALGSFCDGSLGVWQDNPQPVVSTWLLEPVDAADEGGIVGLDIEGWPDKPWGVQFCCDGVTGYVIHANQTTMLTWLDTWLANKRVFLHNGIGDLPVLRAMGINLRAFEDTQLLAYHHALRTGSGVLGIEDDKGKGGQGAKDQNLGTQAYRWCGTRKGHLASIPGVDFKARVLPYNDAMLAYAATDAVAEYRLAVALWDWANETPGILPVYRIDQGQAFLIREMMDHGMPFDYEATTDYYLEALAHEADIRCDLERMAAKRGTTDFNPGSHVQVRKLVTEKYGLRIRKRTKGGAASTNEKALAIHAAHPFVSKLQTHRELTKLIGTYLEPLMETLGGDA